MVQYWISKHQIMPKNLSPDIAISLSERIKAGEWSAKNVLPNERALAEHYGVARNTIRRAMDTIERDGLISREVGRGTMIKEQQSSEMIDIMQRIAGTSPLDIMNMRLIIEPQAAASAATNASESELKNIRLAHEGAIASSTIETFEQADSEFHRRIFMSTRNEFLHNLHDMLLAIRGRQPMVEIRRRNFSEERRLEYCDQHEAIVDALVARDSNGAAKAMRAHLVARSRNLFGE
jgi:DNA-binding FadR family transcriptional regulator